MNKRSDILIIVLFVIMGILLFGFTGYKVYTDFFQDKAPDKKLISLDLYGYTLSKNDNSVYKDNFKALEKVLNTNPIDYSEYAKLISKLFVIDVYTLNNKLTSTDIGGLEFIHKDLRENFKENLGDTLYKNIESNLDGKRTQKLPEVKSIEVTDIQETKYTHSKTEYEGYVVTLTWTYVEDMGYQSKLRVTLIKENDKLYIVKGE
ncbi:MAG: hypothetical protein IKR57_04490 [Bacilli bacterium]|nr:hypothetical protein [Bacilli bacterium]